jgi:hypothetical protein
VQGASRSPSRALARSPPTPELAVRIFAQPTEQAWAVVDEVKATNARAATKARQDDIRRSSKIRAKANIKIRPRCPPVNLPAASSSR